MSTKDQIIDMVRHLPDDVSLDEVKICLNSIADVIASDKDIDQGLGLRHPDVMKSLRSKYQ